MLAPDEINVLLPDDRDRSHDRVEYKGASNSPKLTRFDPHHLPGWGTTDQSKTAYLPV